MKIAVFFINYFALDPTVRSDLFNAFEHITSSLPMRSVLMGRHLLIPVEVYLFNNFIEWFCSFGNMARYLLLSISSL